MARIQNITCLEKKIILEKYKSPQKIWELEKEDLEKMKQLSEGAIKEIIDYKYRENLDRYEEYIKKNNIQILTIFDKEYPERLKNIYDSPIILFAKGNLALLKKDTVAIVGCRECSCYGKNISAEIAYKLAKEKKCIVSGLAKGIDKYAHIGALNAAGHTIAVIGNGLDQIYPLENKNLYERILKENGLIITEYIIGTKPEKMNFPARNRIISGISDGIVVVEAKKKSGALITADFGLEQGKEIFAVPGNINNINSEGTNELIKQGAIMVTNIKDITQNLWQNV